MLTVLYTFFIAPLELFMTTVLDWGYGLFASYGWSIVLMSLVVNTVILPIYNKAEGWQEEERAVKKSFEATEAMIKRTFKGQERFAMLTTMRRQAGYSSKLALRSSLGFFLQIPFFIAAYHLLSNMTVLKGVAFGPIADLGAADGLIAVGDWHINALPLIMTAVNLLSAFVYTARLTKQDKIQLYGLSALFLVLLYTSPAALTFYWTLNNVYSLGKNIVEKSLLPRWRATKHADPFAGLKAFGEKRRLALGILGALLIAADTAITADTWNYISLRETIPALRLEIFLVLLSTGCALLAAAFLSSPVRERAGSARATAKGLTLLAFVLPWVVTLFCRGTMAEWVLIPKEPPLLAWTTVGVGLAALVCALWTLLLEGGFAKLSRFVREDLSGVNTGLAVLLVTVLFLGLPTLILSSDPDSVATTFDVVIPCFMLVAVAGWALTYAYLRDLPRGASLAFFFLLLFSNLLVVGYAFLFVGDYGLINGGELEKTQTLYESANRWKDIAVVAGVAVLSFLIVKKVPVKTVRDFSALLTTLVFILSGVMLLPLAQTIGSRTAQAATETAEAPSYAKDSYVFSKTGQNLLVIVFDMYTADHFPQILKEHPELKKSFEGFTHFVDTTSAGSGTLHALAVTSGGNRFSVRSINRDNEGKTFEQLYAESYSLIPDLLGKDWNSAVIGTMWQLPEAPKNYLSVAYHPLMEDWFNYYYKAEFENARGRDRADAFARLFSISLFKAAPYSLRKTIYANGRWLASSKETLDGFKAFAAFRAPEDFSRTVETGNYYRYVYSDGSHTGRYCGEDMQPALSQPRTPADFRKAHPDYNYSHYLSERAFTVKLASWLDWMRKNGVYDNTRIVVTADHGGRDSKVLFDAIGHVPYKGRIDENVDNPGIRYPLLLWKDFGSKGELRTANDLMTNGDVPDLLLRGIRELPEKYRSLDGGDKRLRYYDSCSDSNLRQESMKCYTYRVEGTMFKKDAWQLENP